MKFLKKYIDKYLSPERIERFFDDLARGKYPITTNQYLKWCLAISTSVFAFVYFGHILFEYVAARQSNLKILEQQPSLVVPIACKMYVDKIRLQGMSIKSFEIILELISIVRFIILAIRFNIPTSFAITTISYLASYIWYIDGIMKLQEYAVNIRTFMPTDYSTLIGQELMDYRKAYIDREMHHFPNMLSKVRALYAQAFTVYFSRETDFDNWLSIYKAKLLDNDPTTWSRLNYSEFFNDPVSLITRILIELPGSKSDNNKVADIIGSTYYIVRERYFMSLYSFVARQLLNYRTFILFTFLVRKGGKYMPYLIRWHWTLSTLINPFISVFLRRGVTRLDFYWRNVLKPEYKSAVRDMQPKPYIEAARFKLELAQYLTFSVILVLLVFYFFAALHAVCGQYFFLPLLTKNTELHIGFRRSRSFYSGGLTSWQDLDESSSQLWHGVLGRGTNKVPVILTIFDFIKNLFIRFFKLFRR